MGGGFLTRGRALRGVVLRILRGEGPSGRERVLRVGVCILLGVRILWGVRILRGVKVLRGVRILQGSEDPSGDLRISGGVENPSGGV